MFDVRLSRFRLIYSGRLPCTAFPSTAPPYGETPAARRAEIPGQDKGEISRKKCPTKEPTGNTRCATAAAVHRAEVCCGQRLPPASGNRLGGCRRGGGSSLPACWCVFCPLCDGLLLVRPFRKRSLNKRPRRFPRGNSASRFACKSGPRASHWPLRGPASGD